MGERYGDSGWVRDRVRVRGGKVWGRIRVWVRISIWGSGIEKGHCSSHVLPPIGLFANQHLGELKFLVVTIQSCIPFQTISVF